MHGIAHGLTESVIVIPGVGLQLEANRGFQLWTLPACSLSTSRRFYPQSAVEDLLLIESISGWSIRFSLGVIVRDGQVLRVQPCFSVRSKARSEGLLIA
jgi:hypothetical protein